MLDIVHAPYTYLGQRTAIMSEEELCVLFDEIVTLRETGTLDENAGLRKLSQEVPETAAKIQYMNLTTNNILFLVDVENAILFELARRRRNYDAGHPSTTAGPTANDGDWIKGVQQIGSTHGQTNEIFTHCLKQNSGPSEKYGIDGGQIVKLEILRRGEIVVNYDRGWDVRPAENDQNLMEAYNRILRLYN